jgi:quercetin dioxygenase-like cupin family protein
MVENFGKTGFIFKNDSEWEIIGDGVRRKILAYEKDMMLVVFEFKKGSIGYLHHHPHKQVGYIVEGSFEVTINGEKKILKAGDAYLTLPNIEHGVVAQEESVLIDVFTPYRKDFLKK